MSDRGTAGRAQARLRGFKLHLLAYFAVVAALIVINLLFTPATIWFVWPMVGWGPVLAIHTAWVMGLFDSILGRKD
jgi:uncharacterized membrane protein YdbT with pleckstrin-like domain